MLMRYYPSLGVGHMHVHTSENADCSQAIPRNFDSNGSEVNSMESEEADVDIAAAPITITGGESDHLDSTDDEDRGGDDPDRHDRGVRCDPARWTGATSSSPNCFLPMGRWRRSNKSAFHWERCIPSTKRPPK